MHITNRHAMKGIDLYNSQVWVSQLVNLQLFFFFLNWKETFKFMNLFVDTFLVK